MTAIIDDYKAIAAAMKRTEEPNAGSLLQKDCPICEGGGWVQVYSSRPPAFDVCPNCGNEDGNPCP